MKKIKLALLIIALIAFCSLIGCTNNQEPKPQVNNQTPAQNSGQSSNTRADQSKLSDFFPLGLDYRWEYQGEGNEYASFTREVIFSNNNLYQIREDNGGTVSASVYKVSPSEVTRVYFMGEEYGQENYLDAKPNENLIILKTPLEVGTSWETPNDTREIVSISETVSTPAGSFSDCIKVKISSENSTVNEYFKAGVGMVKREFISGEAIVTSSLKNYSK